eukprot:CAMPEP_0206623628 /NCGR_PEP_ID=MMETSP0325_2-20121206/63589_1 /ASSEMBLY_ACC=CAM_ASM_000347 /TAXON_ID=2866 /ORGANISM="Crypthecodinium cohnii, Strain Seligo" /LENGTH=644 /DNA_ID=CAMNT_0054147329 /DNA_START=117 /DNA_END=2047 /DNA_ORIENTATION=-
MSFRFALLYAVISMLCSAVLLIWPNCIEGLAQTSPRLGCLASSLWRRRFHDGTEVLALACLAVIEILPGLAPALEPLAQDGAGAASGEGDRGSGWLSEKFFPETLGCLETSGARYVVGVYVGRWLPFLPIQARMEGPPEHCLEACEEYLQLESWTIAGVATEPTLEAAPPHRSRRGAGSDSSSISSSASRFAVPSATSPSSLPTQWGTSVAPSKHTATPPKATTRATTIAAASTSGSDNNPRTSPTSTASSSAASSSPTSPPPFPASRSNSSPSLSPSSSSSSSASPTRSGPATAELDMVILGDIEYGGGGGGGGDEKNGERNSEPMPEKKVIVVTEVLNLPRVVGAALALGGGLRLVILIVRIVEGYILGPHFSEIARLKFGRFVTRVIAPGQLGLAVLRTLYFLGSLQRGQLTPVSACFVVFFNFLLELAWLPLAVLPLYYAHMVAVTVRDSYNFCLGAASTVTALLHEVAELVMKEIYPNVDHELSLPWSTSSTSDDSCAVCLGPLYPDLSEAYQGGTSLLPLICAREACSPLQSVDVQESLEHDARSSHRLQACVSPRVLRGCLQRGDLERALPDLSEPLHRRHLALLRARLAAKTPRTSVVRALPGTLLQGALAGVVVPLVAPRGLPLLMVTDPGQWLL